MADIPPNNIGAKILDDAIQSGYPKPAHIPILAASPEGVIYAPAGWVVTTQAGTAYVKSTLSTLNTGWIAQ